MGKSSIVVCKNSWASGTAGVTLCRVQKVLAAMSSGMKTDPRLPLCKTLPGNHLQTATQGSFARGCDVSGLYLRTRPHAHTCTRGESWSPAIGGRGSRPTSLENSFPVTWAKDCTDKLTCSVWLGGETENRLCVPRGAPRSTRSFK
jgi:hypothetical protein